MRAVWKYPISLVSHIEVEMPQGAEVLSAQIQDGHLMLWALVETEAPLEVREFLTAITGEPTGTQELKHLGTIQLRHTGLVFHIFEIVRS